MNINRGDLVKIEDELPDESLVGLVVDQVIHEKDHSFCKVLYYTEGVCDERWINQIFIKKVDE